MFGNSFGQFGDEAATVGGGGVDIDRQCELPAVSSVDDAGIGVDRAPGTGLGIDLDALGAHRATGDATPLVAAPPSR